MRADIYVTRQSFSARRGGQYRVWARCEATEVSGATRQAFYAGFAAAWEDRQRAVKALYDERQRSKEAAR